MKSCVPFFLLLALAVLPEACAADETYSRGKGEGGMTYSPTEGWVKTSDKQVRRGTDSLKLENKIKAREENRKKMLALAEAKARAAEEAQKAAAQKTASPLPAPETEESKKAAEAKAKRETKKAAKKAAQKQQEAKAEKKRRVMVS